MPRDAPPPAALCAACALDRAVWDMHGHVTEWAVVAVDLDGTLIHGTTACLHLGEWIGHRAVIEELERRFTAGEIASADIADGDAPYYEGRSIADVAEAMTRAPCIDDISEGVEHLASRGVDALLCTVTWTFAAQCVADRFGFSAVSGTVMHVDGDGNLAGRVARYFEPEDKVAFLRDYCESRDLGMHQVVAIGDGQSDLPCSMRWDSRSGSTLHRLRARRHQSRWTAIRSSTHCARFPVCSTTDVDRCGAPPRGTRDRKCT